MKPVHYACASVALWSFINVAMEMKLAKFPAPLTLSLVYSIMLPLAIGSTVLLKFSGSSVTLPTGSIIWLFVAVGIGWFFAAYCYFQAYAKGGDVLTITAVVVTMPLVTSAIKYVFTGNYPNIYHAAGYFLVVAGMILFAIGNK